MKHEKKTQKKLYDKEKSGFGGFSKIYIKEKSSLDQSENLM